MNPRAISLAALVAAFFLLFGSPARAVVDVLENGGTGDGLGDIWQLKFNATGLAPDGDSDGDGHTNAREAGAGTDPTSPSDVIAVRNMELVGTDLTLRWPSLLGKRYKVQSTTMLSIPGSWAEVTPNFVEGTGAELSVTLTAGGAGTFYRVAVYDKDSDGDGVSDWEEHTLGLDPENAYSRGESGETDLQWLTQGLTAVSNISVTAVDNLATEPPTSAPATDPASFVITRAGGIKPLTVNYTLGGPAQAGSDYATVSGSVTFGVGATSVQVPVVPLADTAVESPEAVILTLVSNAAYTIAGQSAAAVVINDRTSPAGNGLRARFYNEPTSPASALMTPNGIGGVPPTWATEAVSRIDATIDYDWANSTVKGVGSPHTSVNTDYFASRWTGEVLPEFSQIYTFSLEHNRCARLWVNGQLLVNKWPGNGAADNNPSATSTGTIELAAGVRYPIVLEHFETTGDAEMHLRWSSTNTPLQIIPQARLFADTPPQITSVLEVMLIKGSGLYNYQIGASGNPTGYAAANLPPGWTIGALTGQISGNPNTAGTWDIALTATNSFGSGSAILRLTVIETGGAITRDVWNEISGTSVSAIPLGLPPSTTGNVTSLEGPLNAADDYGARLRGYVTAPVTGVYKFFLTASDAAELHISDDDEPVNAFLRAQVTAPTAHREWASANAGKSPLLWLTGGRRYYVEVRHKAGAGNDHVSVGWLKPGEGGLNPAAATAPSEVVPGFVLSPYVVPSATTGESTLYVTSMSAQGQAVTQGFGSASLRLSADEAQAILLFTYSNLTSPVAAKHVHSDAHGGQIIFDIDDFTPAADGSYTWRIKDEGNVSAAAIINVIKTGQAYINIHTEDYPNGEIRGNFRLAAASQTFTPPPAQTWSDPNVASNVESSKNRNGAARFLVQSTFGVSGADANANGNPDDIELVQSLGFEGWINDQFTRAPSYHYPFVFSNRNQTDGQNGTYNGTMLFNSWWRNSVLAPDQLRQRVAFALSEILVVSESGPLDDRADALSDYYDMLLDHAFGNFRDVLVQTTLHPAMGRYLDMLRNDKPNPSTGRIPNENYAREILQLFSIGLYRMHPDGSLVLNSKGLPIDTYDQDAIIGFAHAFTGWDYNYTGGFRTSFGAGANWLNPMREVPVRHFTGPKRLLNNVVIPGLPTLSNGTPLDPYGDHSGVTGDAAFQALPAAELASTHDAIFNHPNVGPFICRQLIQRLVTSTPSRGYLYRVVSKFNNNGSGVRGDMQAVIKAILLDYEARSATAASGQGFGKQREPVSRIAAIARAFPAPAPISGTYAQNGSEITVTTSVPHLYPAPTAQNPTSSVFVDFGDSTTGTAGQPLDATYTVTVTGPNSFTFRAKSFEPATYTQSGGITTFTTTGNGFFYGTGDTVQVEYLTAANGTLPTNGTPIIGFRSNDELRIVVGGTNTKSGTYPALAAGSTTMTMNVANHGYAVNSQIRLDFVSDSTPPGPTPLSGVYTIGAVTTNSFTVNRLDTVALPSGTVLATTSTKFGTYAALAAGSTTMTMNVTNHGYAVNSQIHLDFVNGSTPPGATPLSGVYTIGAVTTNSFTVSRLDTVALPSGAVFATLPANLPATTTSGTANLTRPADFANRSGPIAVTYSDWNMGDTDDDLNQTPLGSPTVFNFYLPDYQFPGILANAGLITPEFEITSETTVIRQANFIYNGIFNDALSQSGLSSFKNSGRDIILDYRPWMTGTVSGLPWAHNNNLNALIDELNTRLTGGQISAAGKTIIRNYAATLSYTTPTTSQLRDRIRAVIHLILTSPDFTIQK